MAPETRASWVGKAKAFLPPFLKGHPHLAQVAARCTVIFHGSTMQGVEDEVSDLDFWLLLGRDDLVKLESGAATRFFEIKIDKKDGHLNAVQADELAAQVDACDLPVIAELRTAEAVVDGLARGNVLIGKARLAMGAKARRAFFFHHYVEMRGWHRNADNPMKRHEPWGIFTSAARALDEGLKAAMVLDGEPYPYPKWLMVAAARTPTGKLVVPYAERVMKALTSGGLAFAGPGPSNPVNLELRALRQVLIDAAKKNGITEPWLDTWYKSIEPARAAPKTVRWPG